MTKYIRFVSSGEEYGCEVPLGGNWDIVQKNTAPVPDDKVEFEVHFDPAEDVSDMDSWDAPDGRKGVYVFDVNTTLTEHEEQSFTEYLEEEVFTSGHYTFEESEEREADVKVAEFPDGSGYIIPETLQNALDDERVELVTVFDGWLHVAEA